MAIYMPDKRNVKIGLIAFGVLIIFLAILIPSVTLRSAPAQKRQTGEDEGEAPPRPLPADFYADEDSDVMKRVRRALEEVPLIDTHNDLPWQYYKQVGNHLNKMDLRKNLTGTVHTDIPRMRKGQMGAVFLAAYGRCETQYKDAVEMGLMQVDTIRRLANIYSSDLSFATTADDIEKAKKDGKIGVLIGLEGGHMINSNLAMLRVMYDMGVRYMTLTHSCHTPWADNAYGDDLLPDTAHDSTYEEKISHGLASFGKDVVTEMNRLGMMVDLSHVSEQVMLDALEITRAPVIFSHSSAFAVTPHRRNVRDNVLKKMKENGGVLMLNFWSKVMRNTPDYSDSTMDDLIAHMNHIRDTIGVDYMGFGADYDGVGDLPVGLEDVTSYPHVLARLVSEHGYSIEDVKKIAGENLLRVMRGVEKVKADMARLPADDETLLYPEILAKQNCSCKTIKDFTKEKEE